MGSEGTRRIIASQYHANVGAVLGQAMRRCTAVR